MRIVVDANIVVSEALRVDVNGEMRRRVEELLGPENFHLLAAPRNGPSRPGNGRPRAPRPP